MDFLSGIKDWFGSKPQWNPQLAKTHLKSAMSRMKLQINKKQNGNSQFRREAAQLLKEGKEAQARLIVENIIRQENINKALSQLDVICEHILARFDALNMTSHPPPDLHGAICSVIFACPRLDIQELRQISQNFEIKYGKEFIAEAMANKYNTVNEKILDSLTMARPQQLLVDAYLLEIAKQNNIEWEPDDIAAANAALRQLRPDLAPPEDSDIPEDIPEPALDDVMSDQDLMRELDQIKSPGHEQEDLMQLDDDVPEDIPMPDFGLPSPPAAAPKKQQPRQTMQQPTRQTPPKQNAPASTAKVAKSSPAKHASPTPKPVAAPVVDESDDFELDLPEVPISPPKPHFQGGGDDDNFGGDGGGGLDDLDNLLPQVPPTDPHNHVGKSTNFGAGSGFGSSMASMARKPSNSGSTKPNPKPVSPPPSDSSVLDDDELMARFRKLRDST